MTAAFGFPPVAPAMTLAELYGPVATLALVAVIAVMGVLVTGLLLDLRDGRQRRRTPPTIVTAARRATRPAA
jgi:hypothetical protein